MVCMFIDYDMSRERKTAFQKEKRGQNINGGRNQTQRLLNAKSKASHSCYYNSVGDPIVCVGKG